MNKPRIAVIGANEAIDILIRKAKEKGYETHVFAWRCGDPGEQSADYFYPISVENKEKILEICKGLGILGVASITSDFAVNTVNYVARNLGLICNSERTDLVSRNKYLMRCALRDVGLHTPWFTRVDKCTDLYFVKDHNYPVIVKPTDRWSSKGVTRVDTFAELRAAVNYATSESLTGEAIIEDFMEGPEYSAECICQDGVCHILAFTEKTTTGHPHYIETGHTQPAYLPEHLTEHITHVVKRAIVALDIVHGAAHVEFRVLNNGEIGIIEIGARMGGDYIGTDLVRLTTGYDYVGMVIDVACGKRLEFERAAPHHRKASVHFILCEDDLAKFDCERESKEFRIVRSSIKGRDWGHDVRNSSDRSGYYIKTVI